ncbi:unnamed protein product, partial [Vitis vinifera]
MKQKWGRVIGPAAYREWQWHIASRKRPSLLKKCNKRGLFRSLFSVCPLSWIRPKLESSGEPSCSLSVDSIKAWYLSLESGKLWFPAQVYNRENGHLGFVMSCYDALLSYDSRTDTFRARYSPQGPQTIEENIPWHRLRAPPIDVPPHVLHVSDCLNDLKPGDHIEIQWRKNKELPYGWWYGIISHLETCNGNENHCCCHNNDMLILEFNQYSPGSQWRRVVINRKNHQEEGNGADGFYGGIRKIFLLAIALETSSFLLDMKRKPTVLLLFVLHITPEYHVSTFGCFTDMSLMNDDVVTWGLVGKVCYTPQTYF